MTTEPLPQTTPPPNPCPPLTDEQKTAYELLRTLMQNPKVPLFLLSSRHNATNTACSLICGAKPSKDHPGDVTIVPLAVIPTNFAEYDGPDGGPIPTLAKLETAPVLETPKPSKLWTPDQGLPQ